MSGASRKSAAEVWDIFYQFTTKLSDLSRSLGFSGAAVCWALKGENFAFSPWILAAFLFLVVFFICDIAQYFFNALLLGLWIRLSARTQAIDDELIRMREHRQALRAGRIATESARDATEISFEWPPGPLWVSLPGYVSLSLKIAALLSAYVLIGTELLIRMQVLPR